MVSDFSETYRVLDQALHVWFLIDVDIEKLLTHPQRHDPEEHSHAHGEYRAHCHHISRNLEKASSGHDESGQCDRKCDENENGIDDTRGQGKSLVQQVPCNILAISRRVLHLALYDQRKNQLHDTRTQEESVGDDRREKDLVDHVGDAADDT